MYCIAIRGQVNKHRSQDDFSWAQLAMYTKSNNGWDFNLFIHYYNTYCFFNSLLSIQIT